MKTITRDWKVDFYVRVAKLSPGLSPVRTTVGTAGTGGSS